MEKTTSKFISPIAIDLGSKNTGLFYLHYEIDSGKCKTLSELQKIPAFRKTLVLETDSGSSYQLLMVDRTQRRHQRRGYTRCKLAKRLVRLILEEELNIPMKPHLEALGFLLNRRGFSYTTFEIDDSILRNFPSELIDEYRNDQYAYESLCSIPEILGSEDDSDSVDILEKIHEHLERENVNKLKALVKEVSSTKRRFRYVSSQFKSIGKIADIETELQNEINGLNREYYVNRLKNQLSSAKDAQQIEDDLKNEKKKLVKSVLYFQDKYDILPDVTDTKSLKCKQYFTWVLFRTLEEALRNLQTGHKPRRQYTEDILVDLSNAIVVKGQPISRGLCNLREALLDCNSLGIEPEKRLKRFCNLLGNISNLQIKPLRQYFNNKGHIEKDEWQLDKMHSIYAKWLRSWRPRSSEQIKLRKELLLDLTSTNLMSHWLRTDPKLTIPPYENNNNRRPPKCNSLVLVPSKLSVYLPEWRKITDILVQELTNIDPKFIQNWMSDEELRSTALNKGESMIAYSKILEKFCTKNNKAFSNAENKDDIWKCRTLAFILDRSNGHSLVNGGKGFAMRLTFGPSSLNSQKQKIRAENTKNSLKELLGEKYSSFETFANQYFDEVRLAKEGRLFLETGDCLLETCNEKPRQKRHQSVIDIAGIFGVSVEKFKEVIETKDSTHLDFDEKVQNWLISRSLKPISEKSSKIQKQYGNELSETIQSVNQKIESGVKLDNADEHQLQILMSRIEEIAKRVGNELGADYRKFNSIFSFAQLYNIGFSERSGFSNTCKLCAHDNVRRMQPYKSISPDSAPIALASRISGMSVRVIDGVVLKLLEHKARAIAKLKWTRLKHVCRQRPGAEINIPILIEQNSFNFEKDLNKIKKMNRKIKSIELEERLNKKKERIKLYSGGICPYTGEILGTSGELDHILSRSFTKKTHQTVFNSECNLLYVSSLANRVKNNDELRLKDLHSTYLERLFDTTNCESIENDVEVFVENYDERKFSNFLNLNEEGKLNIRHALFLKPESKARRKVVRMLNSSQRTRVNGTQRYFASLIAKYLIEFNNKIYSDVQLKLSFDYLEIDSLEVYGLRRSYAEVKQILKKEIVQSLESHSIDATLVFLFALKSNRVSEMLGAEPPEIEYIRDKRDNDKAYLEASYNTVLAPFYEYTSFKEVKISRQPTTSKYYAHRPMFRDNFYAGRYLPIVITKEGKIGHGFSESNMIPSVSSSKKMNDLLNLVLPFSPTGKNELRKYGFQANDSSFVITKIAEKLKNLDESYIVLPIHHSLINEYLLAKHNTKVNISSDYTLQELMKKSAYRTERVLLTLVMANDLLDILQKSEKWKKYSGRKFCEVLSKNKGINLFVKPGVIHPVWREWKNFLIDWEKHSKRENDDDFNCFCRKYFKKENCNRMHQRVRNNFSLPIVTGEGKFLQRQKSWSKDIQATFQIANDADQSKGGNKYQIPVVTKEGNVKFGDLSDIYQSKSIHRLKHEQKFEGYLVKYPTWFKLNLDEVLDEDEKLEYSKQGVIAIKYLVENKTRPMIKINLNKDPTVNLFSLTLLKPRYNSDEEKMKIITGVKTSIDKPCIWTLVYSGARYPSRSLKFATKCRN